MRTPAGAVPPSPGGTGGDACGAARSCTLRPPSRRVHLRHTHDPAMYTHAPATLDVFSVPKSRQVTVSAPAGTFMHVALLGHDGLLAGTGATVRYNTWAVAGSRVSRAPLTSRPSLACAPTAPYDVVICSVKETASLCIVKLPQSCEAVCVYTASSPRGPHRAAFERLVAPVVDASRRWHPRGWRRLWCTALATSSVSAHAQ